MKRTVTEKVKRMKDRIPEEQEQLTPTKSFQSKTVAGQQQLPSQGSRRRVRRNSHGTYLRARLQTLVGTDLWNCLSSAPGGLFFSQPFGAPTHL